MTKFAVVALSEVLSNELLAMKSKIKVSVLCPGFVKTNILDATRNAPENVPNRDVDIETALQDFIKIHPEAKEFMDMFMSMWDAGLSPDIVGDIVFEAIKDGAFYIYTDTSMFFKNLVKDRMNGILDAFKQNKPYKRKSIEVYK